MEFFLNIFTQFSEFNDKKNCHYSKRTRTCHSATSCLRDQNATTAPGRHMWERGSLNWAQFMLHSDYQFPWIRWIQRKFCPFRKNSINSHKLKHTYSTFSNAVSITLNSHKFTNLQSKFVFKLNLSKKPTHIISLEPISERSIHYFSVVSLWMDMIGPFWRTTTRKLCYTF